ncbi:MAG: hypothetical protein KDB00_01185 [Planctomycetales bacterium]|nr:hypothetical protein [Planctomycetales bacterium]
MPTVTQRSDRFGIALTMLIALVVWGMHATTVLVPFDDWVVDRWQRLVQLPVGNQVLLVSAADEPEQIGEKDLATLVETLTELGAKSIAVVGPLAGVEAAHEGTRDNGIVLYESDFDGNPPRSVIGRQGVQRRFGQMSDCSFEQCVAKRSLGVDSDGLAAAPSKQAKIRFTSPLPRVDSARVINKELVPEMVSGRSVIVGTTYRQGDVFHIPTVRDRGVDELELRGQIVRCLIAGDWIDMTAMPINALLILLSSILWVQIYRNLNARWWVWCIVVSVPMTMGVVFLSLNWFSIQLPWAAMLSTVIGSHVLVTRQRFQILRSALDRRFSEASANAVRVDSASISRDETADEWKQAADAWYDLFAPTRVALLELESGDTYLIVRSMAGADASDIGERRRDVTRMPYRDAVDQKTATRLTKELFFTKTAAKDSLSGACEKERTQFAVPLIASETIGLVVIEVETSRLAGWDAFAEQAMEFASELATHLAKQRERSLPSTHRGSSLSRIAQLPEKWMADSIVTSNSVAKSADEMWKRAFEMANNPIAICDPFGRVVQANTGMINELQRSGQSLNEFDALDWLQKVTGRSRQECSNLVRRIVLQQRGENLFCKPSCGESLAPILSIRPLARDGEDQLGLNARAMSIELISPSMFADAWNWERAFTNHQRLEIQRRAERCLDIPSIADPAYLDNSVTSGNEFPADWTELLDHVGELISLCQEQEVTFSDSPDRAAPLPMDSVLGDAIDVCRLVVESNGMALVVERCDQLPVGHLNPFYLASLFRTLTECVAADAVAGETVTLCISDVGNRVVCDLYASGVDPRVLLGAVDQEISNDHSGAGLDGLPSEVADEVHRASRQVEAWGGSLHVRGSDDFRVAVRLVIKANRSQRDAARPIAVGPTFANSPGRSDGMVEAGGIIGAER